MNATITTGIEDAYEAYFISQCIILGLIAVVLPFELWGYFQFELSKRRNTTRLMRRSLFCNAIFVTVLQSISMCMSVLKDLTEIQCQGLSILLTVMYFISVLSAYLFLMARIQIIAQHQSVRYKLLLRACRLTMLCFLPVLIIASGWIAAGELTQENGRCMQVLPMWSFILFGLGNLALSSALVYLFVTPLKQNARGLVGVIGIQQGLWRQYQRNAAISAAAVILTFSIIVTYGFLQHYAQVKRRDELNVIGLSLMCWEILILGICCRATSLVWLPKKCHWHHQEAAGDEMQSTHEQQQVE